MNSPVHADTPTSHTVAWGETLYSIARAYGVAPQAIARANGIGINSWVYAGQQLTIPGGGNSAAATVETPSGYYTVRAGDTLFSIASRYSVTVDRIASMNNLPANGLIYVGWTLKIPSAASVPSAPKTSAQSYIVQPGEDLALIALRFGTTAQAIALANSLPNAWMVYAGQRLTISSARASAPVPAASTTDIRVANIPLYQQKQTLTCEEAAAAMATRGAVSEAQLLAVMPRSDNPFAGIRGRTNSPYFGGLSDYGVYAQGLQKGLAALGIRSQVLYGQNYDDFKSALLDNLRAGHPIIWWHTWQDTYQSPVMARR